MDAIERLRRKAQNEATCFTYRDICNDQQKEIESLRQQLAECEREKTAIWESYKDCRTAHDTVTAERNAFQDQCISLKMKMTVMREERDELVEALKQFAECDLNDDNCASLEVATRRIRSLAQAALAKLGADATAPEGHNAEVTGA